MSGRPGGPPLALRLPGPCTPAQLGPVVLPGPGTPTQLGSLSPGTLARRPGQQPEGQLSSSGPGRCPGTPGPAPPGPAVLSCRAFRAVGAGGPAMILPGSRPAAGQ